MRWEGTLPAGLRLWLILSLCAGLSSCASHAKVTDGTEGGSISASLAEDYNGPKARIAVAPVIDKSGASGKRSLSNNIRRLNTQSKFKTLTVDSVTSGVRDMLTTSLFNSDRFIVLEREAIKAVMVEQEFSNTARVGAASSIALGELEGAELLVVAAVTGFDPAQSGLGGFPIPIPVNNDGDIAVLNLNFKKSYVSMNVRVIDTRTSRIVASVAVEGAVRKVSASVSGVANTKYGHVTLPTLLSGFTNTPIEKAMQKMVTAAVAAIAKKTPPVYYHF